MSATFHEIHNDQAPKLKTPHFVVNHKFKHVEKPFPSVASYMVFVGKNRSGKSHHVFANKLMHVHECIPQCDFVYSKAQFSIHESSRQSFLCSQ